MKFPIVRMEETFRSVNRRDVPSWRVWRPYASTGPLQYIPGKVGERHSLISRSC